MQHIKTTSFIFGSSLTYIIDNTNTNMSLFKSKFYFCLSSYACCATLQIEIQLHVKKQTDNVAKVKSHKQKLIVSAD